MPLACVCSMCLCRQRGSSTRLTKWPNSKLVQVSFTGAVRLAADGCASVEIDAHTMRELMRQLIARFPDMAEEVDNGVAVAIDGG